MQHKGERSNVVFTSIPGVSPVDVTSFGAVADNLDSSAAANDAAFIRAYNAVVSAGGGVILVPWGATGAYKTNTGWVIDHDNIALVGFGTRGSSPTIQIASAKDPAYALILGNTQTVNNVYVGGLSFNGRNDTTSTGSGLHIRANGSKLSRVRVSLFGGKGILAESLSGSVFENLFDDVNLNQNGKNALSHDVNMQISGDWNSCEFIRCYLNGDIAQSTTTTNMVVLGNYLKFTDCHCYYGSGDGCFNAGNNNQFIGGEYETNIVHGIHHTGANIEIIGTAGYGNGFVDIGLYGSGRVVGGDYRSVNNENIYCAAQAVIADTTCSGSTNAIFLDTGTTNASVHDNILSSSSACILTKSTNSSIHDNELTGGGITEQTGAQGNDIHDNFIPSGKTITIIGTTTAVRNNPGYNPVGSVSTPAFPASTVGVVNTTGVDVTAYVVNGANAITVISIAGANGTYTATGQTIGVAGEGVFRLPVGAGIKFTYAGGSPTWTWFGD